MRLIILSLATTSLLVGHSFAKSQVYQEAGHKQNDVRVGSNNQGIEEEESPKWKHHPKFGYPSGAHYAKRPDFTERDPYRHGIH